MKFPTLLPAALAALALTGVAVSANAAPPPDSGDYVTRAVRSNNGKDPFVRLVKAPKEQAKAKAHGCAKMKDPDAMRAKCGPSTQDQQGSASAPKG